MAREAIPVLHDMDKGKTFTPAEQFSALYDKSIDSFVLSLNPDKKKYKRFFEQDDEDALQSGRIVRARQRRAAGGW